MYIVVNNLHDHIMLRARCLPKKLILVTSVLSNLLDPRLKFSTKHTLT